MLKSVTLSSRIPRRWPLVVLSVCSVIAHTDLGLRTIAPGELWVLGLDHGVSWDRRHFGPVPTRQVCTAAAALPTFAPGPDQPEVEGDQP